MHSREAQAGSVRYDEKSRLKAGLKTEEQAKACTLNFAMRFLTSVVNKLSDTVVWRNPDRCYG